MGYPRRIQIRQQSVQFGQSLMASLIRMKPPQTTTKMIVRAVHFLLAEMHESYPRVDSLAAFRIRIQLLEHHLIDNPKLNTVTTLARCLHIANTTVHRILQDACLDGRIKGVVDSDDGRRTYYVCEDSVWTTLDAFCLRLKEQFDDLRKQAHDTPEARVACQAQDLDEGPCPCCMARPSSSQ